MTFSAMPGGRSPPELGIEPIGHRFGAELAGIDLSRELGEPAIETIERALDRYLVLALRGQTLTPDGLHRLARRFGPFSGNPVHRPLEGFEDIVRVERAADDTGPVFGGQWHMDLAWFERPPAITMLYADAVPKVGGDTLFANLHLAYDALSDGMKALIADLVTVHSGEKVFAVNAALKSVAVPDSARSVMLVEMEHPRGLSRAGDAAALSFRQRRHETLQGHDRGRESAADRVPDGPCGSARVHLPPGLGGRHPGPVAERSPAALRDRRLWGQPPGGLPHHGRRSTAALSRAAARVRVLVTGAAGRVGSTAVARLLEAGHAVTGFDLRAMSARAPRLRTVAGSLRDAGALGAACAGADAVLHLASLMSWRPGEADALFATNVVGTRNVLAAAVAAGVSRFVFASSGEVYPEGRPACLPIAESHPCRPVSDYGMTKLLGEELVRFYQRRFGLPCVILRFSHVQDAGELLDPESFFSGPRFFLRPKIRQQRELGRAEAVERLRAHDDGTAKLVLSRDERGRAFRMVITETRDIVEGVLLGLTAEAAAGETFNLGTHEAFDFEPALERMARETGLPLARVDLPGPGVFYSTSSERIGAMLGFRSRWSVARMLDEAIAAWRGRGGSGL